MDAMTNESLIADFASDLIARNLSATTIRQYPLYVRLFADFFDRSLLDADESSLSSYLAHLQSKKLEQSSIKRYFTALSTFYEFTIWKRYITRNPVLPVRKHYLKNYKSHDTSQRRQCISLDQAKSLVRSILDPEERAIIVLFLKTGMRLSELVSLDVGDVDMDAMTIRLHPTGKRSNEIVYFDYETARVLTRWLRLRDGAKTEALFIGRNGRRLSPDAIERIVTKHAVANELHDPSSNRHQLQSRLTPHCLRHWFTTRLIEADCPREYVKELRGDSRTDVIDIYTHIDKKKLRAIYLAKIPQLGLL